MLIVLYTAIAVFALTALFFGVIYPFVCIVECALSKKIKGSSKIIWIAVTFITGIVGAAAYTFLAMQPSKLRSLSFRGMAVGLLSFLTIAGLLATQPQLRQTVAAFDRSDASATAGLVPGHDVAAQSNADQSGEPRAASENLSRGASEGSSSVQEVASQADASESLADIEWPSELTWAAGEAELAESLQQLQGSIKQLVGQATAAKTSEGVREETRFEAEVTGEFQETSRQSAVAASSAPQRSEAGVQSQERSELPTGKLTAAGSHANEANNSQALSAGEQKPASKSRVDAMPSVLEGGPAQTQAETAPRSVSRRSSGPVNRYRAGGYAPSQYRAPVPYVRNRYTGQ